MATANSDRSFAEVHPRFATWLAQEYATPIEWAFRYADIPICYVEGLIGSYGVVSDAMGLAAALLPATRQNAPGVARAEASRTCVHEWEDARQYRAAGRIWCGLAVWVDVQEQPAWDQANVRQIGPGFG